MSNDFFYLDLEKKVIWLQWNMKNNPYYSKKSTKMYILTEKKK